MFNTVWKRRAGRIAATVLAVLLFFVFLPKKGVSSGAAKLPLDERISNCDEIVRSLRHGLRNNSSEMTVSFSCGEDVLEELSQAVSVWMERALEETGDPAEGDYIRCRYGGYDYSCERTAEKGIYHYQVTVVPVYYSWKTQEDQADARAEELFRELGIPQSAGDEEKIRIIYDWICRNVSYDKVHRKNPYSHTKSTGYSALVLGTATCQGYCAALYRLLRMAGMECRVVTGQAGRETLHAWVIVRIGEWFYLLDPTMDAGAEEYQHYLLGTGETPDYLPEEKYRTEAFRTKYPLAAASF